MPYFINCPRCNADNTYSNLGTGKDLSNSCSRCSGTGRDWRDDNELKGFHSWANISIEELKNKTNHMVEHNASSVYFTYRDAIPEHSIKREIEEIKQELNLKEPEYISQIFCTHEWARAFGSDEYTCIFCKKTRGSSKPDEQKTAVLNYNKQLQDLEKYFPNRCYACEEYANTTSDQGNPQNGADKVFCNIGGIVRADDGCKNFKPDNTAECDSCWNFTRSNDGTTYHCDIQGSLTNMVWGGCPYHVEKERLN